MQKEERQLDKGLEDVIMRINELRNSINTFILKLENEYMTLNWLNVLDNFALLSGQVNMINKQLKNDKMPALRNLTLFPLKLSPNRDPELERLTEGRVAIFSHDVAPLYLRTKPDPEIEDKVNLLSEKSNKLTSDNLQKLTVSLNRHCGQAAEHIRTFRESMDNDVQKHSLPQLSSPADTNALIAAVVFGKGLKPSQRPITPSSGGPLQQPSTGSDQRMAAMNQQQQQGGMPLSKAPSSIKTNIKSAGMHPYAR